MENDPHPKPGQFPRRFVRDRFGLKVLNEKPIDCRMTPCQCDGPWRKPMFTPFERHVFHRYRLCEANGTLPKAGGLDDQNPIEMEFFAVLRSVDDSMETRRQNERMRNAGPLAPLLMLMGGGRRK